MKKIQEGYFMWDLAILNGNIVTAQDSYVGNIYVRDGKIGAVTVEPLNEEAKETIDAAGLDVFAGFMDTHIHSRDGGAPQKDTFYHSTRGAAMGGLTTVFEMPNAIPSVSTVENFNTQVANLTPKAHVDFAMWGICLGDLNNDHIDALSEAGVIAFKFFWGYALDKSTYGLVYNYDPADTNVIPPLDDGKVYSIFNTVAKTGKVLAIHAENASIISELIKKLKVEDYANEYEALLACRPNLVEETVIQMAISFARVTGARLHILHASAAEGVDLAQAAQEKGLPITIETCPHYLFLTNEDFERVGNNMKGYPLVREKSNQDRLWKGINDGVICNICSDHAPHTAEEKKGNIFTIPSGMCGVDTLAPLMIGAVSNGDITKQQLARLLSENPARLYNIYPRKGSLQVGTDADITIVDFNKELTIKENELQSVSKITAFDGFRIKGAPVRTIVRGITVMADRKIVSEPIGELIKP